MENIKFGSTRKRGIAAACACVISIVLAATLCLGVLSNHGYDENVAYADNDSSIGAGGGTLNISDVTDYAAGVYGYNGATAGVTLKISAPASATGIYIAYDVDAAGNVDDAVYGSDDWFWAIKGDDVEDSEIPYMKVTGEGSVSREDEGSFFDAEWTAVTTANSTKTLQVTVHINGELNVMCTFDGENPMYANRQVREIDWMPPVPEADKYGNLVEGYRATAGNGSYVFKAKTTFTDRFTSSEFGTGYSGIFYVAIFYTDAALSNEDAGEGGIQPEWNIVKEYSINNVVQLSYVLEFDIADDGYYYYYALDRVGNMSVGALFADKVVIEVDERFTVDVTVGGVTTKLNVQEYMTSYGAEIENNKDKVNTALYEKASSAYGNLMLAFMASDPDVGELYFSFVDNELKEFTDGYKYGADYVVEIINEDLLFGELTVLNFDSESVKALGGDVVKIQITVARFERDYDSGRAAAASGIEDAKYVYRLSYRLTVNDVLSAVPSSAVIIDVSLADRVKDIALVTGSNGEYDTGKFVYGASWVRFETSYNSADYFFVTAETDPEGDGNGLMPLWITLGVLGGLAVTAGAVIGILFALGKLPRKKNAAKAVAEAPEEKTEPTKEETSDDKRTPSNKSKKKKRK